LSDSTVRVVLHDVNRGKGAALRAGFAHASPAINRWLARRGEPFAVAQEARDIARRSDLSKCFVLSADDPTVLANWKELLTPPDAVPQAIRRVQTRIFTNFKAGR